MRRVRFRDPAGNVRRGEWTGAEGAEITARADYGGRVALGTETFAVKHVDVLPPCEPSKVVCVGRNYPDHAAESGGDVPDRPPLFLKPPNAVAAHGDTVTLPRVDHVDHEAELAVVVSDRCKDVVPEHAEEVISGYTCLDDLSNRTDQHCGPDWVRGKAFDGAAPIGPVVATPEHLGPEARISARVNGERRRTGSIADMRFPIGDLLAEITDYLTLEPGDVVATGTPAGVGRVGDGDVIEVEIEGIGTLCHSVTAPD
jgi:2-keto-4-pentenoate hydratase/2-oxohepta-3-ene-1,7-dioic acid hydratase in catechol pathway